METNLSQERLETLLALAIAFCEKEAVSEELNQQEQVFGNVKKVLSALPQNDVEKINNKLSYFQTLPEEEKKTWKSRVLSRIQTAQWLDKNIHHSHICEVLREEPLHLQCFILSNLPINIADPIAITLGIYQDLKEYVENGKKLKKLSKNKMSSASFSKNPLQNDPTQLVRRNFLNNFVSIENIYSPKPIDYLTSENMMQAIYTLGVSEIALACCGIKEIENLASFLRQFGSYTSQLIVDKLAGLAGVDPYRVALAEKNIQIWWEKSENDTSALLGFIGAKKFAGALTQIEEIQYNYVMQKLPLPLSKKIDFLYQETVEKLMENDPEEIELVEICKSEMEALSSHFLLEKMQGRKQIDVGFDAPEFQEGSN